MFENGYDPLGGWIDPIRNNQILKIRGDAIKLGSWHRRRFTAVSLLWKYFVTFYGVSEPQSADGWPVFAALRRPTFAVLFFSINVFFFLFLSSSSSFGRDGLLSVLDI